MFVSLLILLLPFWAGAQQPPPPPVFTSGVSLVLLDAVVRDGAGRPIQGLRPASFRVLEDGAERGVTYAEQNRLPLAMALVVDASISIADGGRLRKAAEAALKSLKPEDRVSLFTFSDHVEQPVSLSADKAAVAEQIKIVENYSTYTNINDAVDVAAQGLRLDGGQDRKVIVLVSDNEPTVKGRRAHEDILKDLLASDVVLYSIRLPSEGPWVYKGQGMVRVEELAQESGGELIDSEKAGSLKNAFTALTDGLRSRYTIAFAPASGAEGLRSLQVQVAAGSYLVRAKKAYYYRP